MATTLHERLSSDLLKKIASREWKVGDRLPPEKDLAEQLGVSRATLRMAFSELESKGVLKRRKRAGTTVISDRPQTVYRQVTGGLHDVLSFAKETDLHVTDIDDVAEDDCPETAGLQSGTGYWLRITGERRLIDSPETMAWTQMFVPGPFSGVRPLIQPVTQAVYALIEEAFKVKVTRLTQSVSAVDCPAAAARALQVPEGSPALHISAQLFAEDKRLIEATSTYFHPAKFQVRSEVEIV